MFEVPIETHVESLMSNTLCIRLKASVKEVSDYSFQTCTKAGVYYQSGEAVGCQLA
jgi:predicted secreted Zn-dependent protease